MSRGRAGGESLMPRLLSRADVERYAEEGFLSPLDAFSEATARAYRARLEAAEAAGGGRLPQDRTRKLHLYLAWVDEIVHDPAILDAVEDLIGGDILLYHLTLWIKEAHTDAFISWHQDSTYFGLDPAEHVTAWVALSPSDRTSGCVQVVPGSHRDGQVRHGVEHHGANMLRTGQQITVDDDARKAMLVLRPGQFSLHHTHLVHGSPSNESDDRRIGLGISYIPTRCRCISATRLSAMLVRGTDRFGHFDLEQRPAADMDPAALDRHAEAMRRWQEARKELIPRAHRVG